MSFSTEWDIKKYKTAHETKEQWLLKKKFMKKHKDKLPEDDLVCLAQVMINIEYLGCRYPQETMTLVAELSKDIADSLREKRAKRLKRTFVTASDAANAKVLKSKTLPTTSKTVFERKEIRFVAAGSVQPEEISSIDKPQRKRQRISEDRDIEKEYEPTEKEKKSKFNNYEISSSTSINFSSKFGELIIYDNDQHPNNMLEVLKHKSNAVVTESHSLHNNEHKFEIFVNNILAGTGIANNRVEAKKTAAANTMEHLRSHCYTIKVKNNFVAQDNRTIEKQDSTGKTNINNFEDNKIGENNVGFKLLKSLGWTGGSLGTNLDAIVDPIGMSVTVGRSGLGSTSTKNISYYKNLLKNYRDSSDLYDLVFSSEFNNEERALFHKLARSLNLKSKSYSKDSERHLVVSKKVTIFDIAKDLAAESDSALMQKFKLIPPTNLS